MIKNIIKGLLKKAGYDLIKIDDFKSKTGQRSHTISLAGSNIDIPNNNPLWNTYKSYPDFNSLIGKIAGIIFAKNTNAYIIDVGANIGDTITIVRKYSKAPIIAIEGDELPIKYLEKNTKKFDDIIIIQTFLGDEDKILEIDFDKKGWNTTIIPSNSGTKKISVKKLDTILNELPIEIPNLNLIKIDTEGFDTIILRGAIKALTKYQPVVFFEYNKNNMEAINENGLLVFEDLKRIGYKDVLFFDEMGRFIISCSINDQQIISTLHNYISPVSRITYYDICVIPERFSNITDHITKL